MVIENFIAGKRSLFWTVFHAMLGVICTITPFALIVWFYFILFSNIGKSLQKLKSGKPLLFIVLFTYLTSFEMLGRMAKTFPFIPTELSKYGLLVFGLLGILVSGKYNVKYILIAILISISLFFDSSRGQRVFTDIINNHFGVLAICLSLSFLGSLRFEKFNINNILKLIVFAILPSLIYSFIKTPDFEDIDFQLKANFETSGGAATNQVSTVFGLGLVICFYCWYKKIIFSGYRWLDLLIGLGFFIQALLTFSRGGIFVSVVAILVLISFDFVKFNMKFIFIGFFSILTLVFIFSYIDSITGGKLYLRYQGETEGTYNYGVEKNLNKITSGRSLIFEEDLKLWFEYPIWGTGAGASRHIRGGGTEKISSHVELSRVLAEYGIFGIIYFFSLFNIGIGLWHKFRLNKDYLIYFVIFLIGFLTTFHSAMRTFVTPLLISLSIIGLRVNNRKTAI